jgi:hypothetical protein
MSLSFRDYTAIVFFYTRQPEKFTGIRNLGDFINWLEGDQEKDLSAWKYINIYDPRDKKFVKRLYKGSVSRRELSELFSDKEG